MGQVSGGTVTLLFTDLVGSTELLDELGDDQADELHRSHFRLLREAVAASGGREVKSLGDGLMVVFPSATSALICAVAMQQAVHRHNNLRPPGGPELHVRIGVHAGEPIRDEQDFFGTPVVIARRLCESAEGGQILSSEVVRGLVGSRGGHTFRNLGALRLKGFAKPLPASLVVWEPAPEPPEVQESLEQETASRVPLPPLLAGAGLTAFVGRAREMEMLERVWARTQEGERQLVLLTGEPGIGKTRLATEFAAAAHDEGATVLLGRAVEEPLTPYQAFAEALGHYISSCPKDKLRRLVGSRGAILARIVPELAQRLPEAAAPTASAEDDRYQLFHALTSLLESISRATPLILVLDDLQRADKETVRLLSHIVRSPERAPLLVLGVYREAEVDRAAPLSEMLADLRRDRGSERVLLGGLDRDGVGDLIKGWADDDAPPALVRTLHNKTEGNPFFVEEVLRHLSEKGALSFRDGRLEADVTVARRDIPEGVRDVIHSRLSRLSDECNTVLTIASVIGREFGLDALERASNLSKDELLKALDEAIAAHVVAEVPQTVGRYSFSHGLIYETLYAELSTTRRVHIHGQMLQYADSGGVKLAYEVLGNSGPHLIAVGLTSCPAVRTRIWASAQVWNRMARICRVILYDRRGVGFSAAPERGYSLMAAVEDLRAVLDTAQVEQAVLWGATDGGPLAIAFAVQHPERVAGLLLLGTTPKCTNSEDFKFGINPTALASFLRTDTVDPGGAISRLVTETRQAYPGAEEIGEVMRRVPPRAWSKLIGGIGSADTRSLLEAVRTPTLIMHDPDNTYIPVAAARYLHEHIPDSELEVTDEYGAGGFGEGAYRRLAGFIDEVTSGSAD